MTPESIDLNQGNKTLSLTWPDGVTHSLTCEFLRVHSPSAEVRGHGPGQEVLQVGKQDVNIVAIEPVGHYAIKLVFDDGHDSGLYDWRLLRKMGDNKDSLWQSYLEKMRDANASRKG